MLKKAALFIITIALFCSCVSRKKITYYQNISELDSVNSVKFEPTLQPDDLLMIIVSASDPEAAVPFNLPAVGVMGAQNSVSLDMAATQLQYQSYLVDNEGDIQFPIIGKIKLGGLTRTEAMQTLQDQIRKYVNDPIVNMRILNYKVTVSGEVVQPGEINITTERITLPEALSMAGDLTIYGDRSNILIVREQNGQKTYNYIDITKADFINTPYYYLAQNDHVYVQPNKTKINSSAVGPNTSIIISAVSLLITVIALVIR